MDATERGMGRRTRGGAASAGVPGGLRSTPRISVIMPVRDMAGTVGRAVESIVAQDWSDWELIVVDDGSTDGTSGVLEAWARRDVRVRVERRAPAGIVAALGTGLAAARGEFVARMDADDVSLPGRFSAQVAFLERHGGIGVAGTLVRFGGDPVAKAGYAAHVAWLNGVVTPEAMARSRFIEAPLAHPSVMFRRELAERLGGYREGPFPEDYELWLRWLEAGVRMAKVEQELVIWNDPPGRLSRADARYAPSAFFGLKARYLTRWLAREGKDRGPVWVWGAGRVTRRRVEALLAEGVAVERYIDVDARKWGRHRDGRVVVGPESIPRSGEAFLLGYVANRGAREAQRAFLEGRGWVEGADYLFVA